MKSSRSSPQAFLSPLYFIILKWKRWKEIFPDAYNNAELTQNNGDEQSANTTIANQPASSPSQTQ